MSVSGRELMALLEKDGWVRGGKRLPVPAITATEALTTENTEYTEK